MRPDEVTHPVVIVEAQLHRGVQREKARLHRPQIGWQFGRFPGLVQDRRYHGAAFMMQPAAGSLAVGRWAGSRV